MRKGTFGRLRKRLVSDQPAQSALGNLKRHFPFVCNFSVKSESTSAKNLMEV